MGRAAWCWAWQQQLLLLQLRQCRHSQGAGGWLGSAQSFAEEWAQALLAAAAGWWWVEEGVQLLQGSLKQWVKRALRWMLWSGQPGLPSGAPEPTLPPLH